MIANVHNIWNMIGREDYCIDHNCVQSVYDYTEM